MHSPQLRARIRKLSVHDHMTHVIKIDILTGHEEPDCLQFILKIIFNCEVIKKQNKTKQKKNMHFLKTCIVNYESKEYCLTKFCYNFHF